MSGFWSYRGKDVGAPSCPAGRTEGPPLLRSLLPSAMDSSVEAMPIKASAEHAHDAQYTNEDVKDKSLLSATTSTEHMSVDAASIGAAHEVVPTAVCLPDTALAPFAQATVEATALREVQARWWRDRLGVALQAQSIATLCNLNGDRAAEDCRRSNDGSDTHGVGNALHEAISRDDDGGGSRAGSGLAGEQPLMTRECKDVIAAERQLLGHLRPANTKPASTLSPRTVARRPAFVQRMEQRAAARRAAWARLATRQHAKTAATAIDGDARHDGATAHATSEGEGRSPFVVPRRVSPCLGSLRDERCRTPAGDPAPVTRRCVGARRTAQQDAMTTSCTQTAFVRLVRAIRRELGFVMRDGDRGALRRELARVAADYHAVRLVQRVMRRWYALLQARLTGGAAAPREAVKTNDTACAEATTTRVASLTRDEGGGGAASQYAGAEPSVTCLMTEEQTARWRLMDEAAAQWGRCVAICRRRAAYLGQSARRGQERQLQLLRWYFVSWAGAVEARRVRQAGQRYADRLMQCAQDVLRGLPYTPL